MRNLLSAGIVRLFKSRLFWLLAAAETAWSGFLAWLLYDYSNLTENLNMSVFMPMFYICVAEATFCGFYIGTDYSDGTVRNKISVGHTKRKIYLSNLIICCLAGTALLLVHIAVILGVGLALIGPAILPDMLLIKTLCALITVIAGTSLFTAASMLLSRAAFAVAANIFISLGMIASGLYVLILYSEPEFVPGSGGLPNPRYVGGAGRAVLEFFEKILPVSSAYEVMRNSCTCAVCFKIIGFSLLAAAAITLAGLAAFRRKNIA